MDTFSCPNCHTQLTFPHDLAGKTVSCGSCRCNVRVPLPIRMGPSPQRRFQPQRSRVQTTEATGKQWKLPMLLGGLAGVAGGIAMYFSIQRQDESMRVIATALMLVGGSTYLFGRVGAWWFHG